MFIKSNNKICIQYNYLIKIQEQTFNKLIFKYKKTTLFQNVVFYFDKISTYLVAAFTNALKSGCGFSTVLLYSG